MTAEQVPLSAGVRPVPGMTGRESYVYDVDAGEVRQAGPGRGRLVLDWCPRVTRHLGQYTSDGTGLTARKVTIEVDGMIATVPMGDVDDGSVWRTRFQKVQGRATRDVRDLLTNIVEDQASRLPLESLTPRWVDGRLVMPPPEACPRGYGQVAGTREEWQDQLRQIARSPRMMLVAGLALGGLYLQPLARQMTRQSYVVHLPGGSSEGKTSTMIAAASMFGYPDPEGVVESWSVTKQGPGAWLRSMHCLTGFRDELGASGITGQQLESLLLSLMQGSERGMSERTGGGYRESQGSWKGALISSGNVAILGQITNEGIAARVIEIRGGLTIDATHADLVTSQAKRTYGHALAAIVERGPTPDAFRELMTRAAEQLGLPPGGVPRRIGEHLVMGIAGVMMLADLAGVPEITTGVADAAREILADLLDSLAERGTRPGDRLLAAVRESMAARVAEWPDLGRYRVAARGEAVLPREIFGWDLRGEEGEYAGWDVAILPGRIKAIAAEAEIMDVGIALGDLVSRQLIRRTKSAKGRQTVLRIGNGDTQKVYVLRGVTLDDGPDEPDVPSQPQQPALALVSEPTTGAGSVPDEQPDVQAPEPPAVEVPPPAEPVSQTAPELAPAVEPATPVDGLEVSPAGPVLALAADLDGIYLPDGTVLEPGPAGMGAWLDRVAELMPTGSVAITHELAAALGYPAGPQAQIPASVTRRRRKAEPPACPALDDATAAGWSHSRKGIGGWTAFWRGTDVSLQVAVLDWQTRQHISGQCALYLSPDDTPMEAAYLLGRWRELAGVPHAYNAGSSLTGMIREEYSPANRKPGGRVPKFKWDGEGTPAAGIQKETHLTWRRPWSLWTPEEQAAPLVVPFDRWNAYLAALGSAELPWDGLVHAGVDGGFDKTRAGYWLIAGTWYARTAGQLLPDLTHRNAGDGDGPVWRTTDTVRLLLENGMPPEAILDAWLAPERPTPNGRAYPGTAGRGRTHTGRVLLPVAKRLSEALLSIPEGVADPAEGRVRASLKAAYSEGYGMLAHGTPWVKRPDWADIIVSTARCTILRQVIRIGQETGRWPVGLNSDCAYYTADTADPEAANPGLKLAQAGPVLGAYRVKPGEIVSVEEWRAKLERSEG
ncbi:DUF927 domain-containing protein [Nonomuraea ceibae]|uniref:DUF927 domain-containing protein n=1 Tax=Nonomuraea ceibae TaxID=1935170 RepID=UPI001C5CF110|nr:DUF927 domain-containing protein [Nonomuraea ceibae]